VPVPLLQWIGRQLRLDATCWPQYAEREETRREHLLELRTYSAWSRSAWRTIGRLSMPRPTGLADRQGHRAGQQRLDACGTNTSSCRRWMSSASVPKRSPAPTGASTTLGRTAVGRIAAASTICSNAATTARRLAGLAAPVPGQAELAAHARTHRTPQAWQALDLPSGIERLVHQNRLLKIAREGGQMTPADLAKFEPQRRYATLVALAIEGMATVTDEIIDLHDRILASCSMPPRTSISSSSRRPARRSMPRCGCSAASGRR
jgi:hypothetical protein